VTTYHGFASTGNGARGKARNPATPIDLVVLHLWVSPEDGPDRYLKHLATPNLPGVSGRVFQSRNRAGAWYWETATGTQTTDPAKAKRWPGPRQAQVYRSGTTPITLVPNVSPMPWCFGAGYHGVAGPDGEPYWAADPQTTTANHAPPVNDRSVGFCLPGRYQTRHEWLNVGNSRQFIRAAAKAIVWAHEEMSVPLARVTDAQIDTAGRGYCDHAAINRVYGQSDHGDLGSAFPWDVLAQDIDDLTNGDQAMRLIKVDGPAEHALFSVAACTSITDGNLPVVRYITHCEEQTALQKAGVLDTSTRIVAKADLRWMYLVGPEPPASVSTVKATDFAGWAP